MPLLRNLPWFGAFGVLCGALSLAALGGCEESRRAVVDSCNDTPEADGLYACGLALVRKEEPPAGCVDEVDGHSDSCARDSDCPLGTACYCGPMGLDENGRAYIDGVMVTSAGGRCIRANCRTSADCGEGNSCVGIHGYGCAGPTAEFACTTGEDECVGAGDCEDRCVPDASGQLICESETCG